MSNNPDNRWEELYEKYSENVLHPSNLYLAPEEEPESEQATRSDED